MKKDITELFCFVDDFAKDIEEVKAHQLGLICEKHLQIIDKGISVHFPRKRVHIV